MWFIWKITIAVTMVTHTTQAVNFVCYNGSITNYKELPLTSIGSFLNTAFLPAGCALTVMIHGIEALFSDDISSVLSNLISQSVSNKCFCSLNWNSGITNGFDNFLDNLTDSKEALSDILNPVLGVDPLSIISELSKNFLTALKILKNGGMDLANLHLIGFSEGALVAGLAGQALKDTNIVVGRITGLNPVSMPFLRSLQKGAANLVDCIHTTHGLFSTDSAPCDIDFFVNRGCNVQPGCTPSIFPINSDSCSRKRAGLLLADAAAHPNSLQGLKASSFDKWMHRSTKPSQGEINYIGPNMNSSLHGSFFLSTASNAPFGKGVEGCYPSNTNSRAMNKKNYNYVEL